MVVDEVNNVKEEHTIFNNEPATTFDDDAEEVKEEKKTRIGHCQKFPQDILNIGYKKRSDDLSFWQQQNRTNEVSKQILASCIDQKELRDSGMGYIEKNIALALDVVTYIDLLILNLSRKLELLCWHLIIQNATMLYIHKGDDWDTVVWSLQKKQKGDQTLACDILKEVTGCAYNRLRARIINETHIDESTLQSLYHLTKDWPKIDSWTYFGSTYTGTTTAGTVATTTTTTVGPTHTDSSSSTTPPTIGTTTTTTVGAIDTLKQIDDNISTIQITKNNDNVKQVAKILGEEKGYLVAKIE